MLLENTNKKYKLLVEKLYERCQEIQTENERNVLRITHMKKLIRRRVRDVELLKHRLDRYNDHWRSLPMVAPHPKRKIEQKRGPKPKPKDPNEQPKEKKVRKRRTRKILLEPNVNTSNSASATDMMGGNHVPQQSASEHFTEQQAQQLLLMQQHHNKT